MTIDPRWKNPPGSDAKQMHLWAQDTVKELRKGDFHRTARDYVTPEDYGASGTTAKGTANDSTNAFANAMNEAVSQQKKFVTRGYFNGTRKWFKITPTLTIPDGLRWHIDGKVGIIGSKGTGTLLSWTNVPYMDGDLIIDGTVTDETVNGGLVLDHTGLAVQHPTFGTDLPGSFLRGLTFQNFGEYGLRTHFLLDSTI